MSKHRLIAAHGIPQASDYSVSDGVIEAWRLRALLGVATSHAACDCTSYRQHDSLRRLPPHWPDLHYCPGPLATIHVERRRTDQLAAHALMEQCPWLGLYEAVAMVRQRPVDTGSR